MLFRLAYAFRLRTGLIRLQMPRGEWSDYKHLLAERSDERSSRHAVEAPLLLESIPRWEECFITSTNRHVMPVTAVDGRPVGDGRVGPVTQRVMGLFEECFSRSVGCP